MVHKFAVLGCWGWAWSGSEHHQFQWIHEQSAKPLGFAPHSTEFGASFRMLPGYCSRALSLPKGHILTVLLVPFVLVHASTLQHLHLAWFQSACVSSKEGNKQM